MIEIDIAAAAGATLANRLRAGDCRPNAHLEAATAGYIGDAAAIFVTIFKLALQSRQPLFQGALITYIEPPLQ
jgi:hypothetical protein